MYAPDTILVRKEPFPEPDPKGKTDEARAGHEMAPFNRIRVIGPSPVQMSGALAEWQGGQSAGVLVQPHMAFGPTVDRPLGELQRDYDVEFVPERSLELSQKIRVIDAHSGEAGPSPEDVFRDGLQESVPQNKALPANMMGQQ